MIHGWARTTLIDFPEHVASVVFTGGCSFRCPMCHNADLVLRPESLERIDEDEVLAFLTRRRGLIDGLVVTGGEPTIHDALPAFLERVRELNVAIKLDTNGYHPRRLKPLLDCGLVDYVAMDVKAPPDKYAQLAGLKKLDLKRIQTSIELLRSSNVLVEFRTTVIPEWLVREDILEIGRWLSGSPRYVLQQFRPQGALEKGFEELKPYPADELRAMMAAVQPFVRDVFIRGV